jgi:hypothetical protein
MLSTDQSVQLAFTSGRVPLKKALPVIFESARQRCYLATVTTLRQLRPGGLRSHRARLCRAAPTWVPGAFFPDRSDGRAGTFDHRVVASF